MGFFSRGYSADHPLWQQIAIHELGHALVWADAGIRVKEVVFKGEDSYCNVQWDPDNLVGYAVGCWGGYEAEVRWFRSHRGSARRGNSGHDIDRFKQIARHMNPRISEGKARSLARAAVSRQWGRIERAMPRLIITGRISGSQL